jgi:hypothetical protein
MDMHASGSVASSSPGASVDPPYSDFDVAPSQLGEYSFDAFGTASARNAVGATEVTLSSRGAEQGSFLLGTGDTSWITASGGGVASASLHIFSFPNGSGSGRGDASYTLNFTISGASHAYDLKGSLSSSDGEHVAAFWEAFAGVQFIRLNPGGSDEVFLNGRTGDGSTSFTFDQSGTLSPGAYRLSFNALSYAQVTAPDMVAGWTLENFTVHPVPEPAAAAGLVLCALPLALRRRENRDITRRVRCRRAGG